MNIYYPIMRANSLFQEMLVQILHVARSRRLNVPTFI